jgi:hypothetical protein
LPKHVLIEPQDVRISLNVVVKPEVYEGTSDIVADQRLFHDVEGAFDKPCRAFIRFQRKFVVRSFLEIPEKTQVEALKYLTRVRWESNGLRKMISKQSQCITLDMNRTIIHRKNSFFLGELGIRPQPINVGDKHLGCVFMK